MPNSSGFPTVGVLLATYNGAAYVEDQILSLLWQRDVGIHVYVRDDGSRDDTLAIIDRLAWRYPDRLTLIDNRGVLTGLAAANFFALLAEIDLDRHDYVAFADQDDIWFPDKLCQAVATMVRHGADGYSSDLLAYHEGRNTAWILDKRGADTDLDYLFQGASAGCTYLLTAPAAKLATSVMAAAPPLCRGASHDWIVYAICRSHGLAWYRDRGARIVYRQHAANQYGARQGWHDLVAKAKLTRSGWYRTQILWLVHVIRGSEREREVLAAVKDGGILNRWRLIRQASRFRRTRGSVLQLRAAILLGSV